MGVGRVAPLVLFGRGCTPGHLIVSEAETDTLQDLRGAREPDNVLFWPVWS